jgi:predicted DNA binding CopG/RHH family protein
MTIFSLPQLMERRVQICNDIAGITSMRRGTLNEIYRQQKLKNGTVAQRGPFYNITTKVEKNKTVTTAVPKEDLERVRQEVGNYKNFRSLSDEYIDVCEKISLLTAGGDDAKKTESQCRVFP